MAGAVREDVADYRPVGEPQDVVEVPQGVLGVAAGVGAAERGDGPAGAAEVAQGVGRLRGLGEGADEHHVGVGGHRPQQVLAAGVADEGDVVPVLPAPGGDRLGHDAGQVRRRDPREEGPRGAPRHEVDDAEAQPSHRCSPGGQLPHPVTI
jgi:hypothetical protein